MGDTEFGKEQKELPDRQKYVRTIFLACWCSSSLLLLLFYCNPDIWSSFSLVSVGNYPTDSESNSKLDTSSSQDLYLKWEEAHVATTAPATQSEQPPTKVRKQNTTSTSRLESEGAHEHTTTATATESEQPSMIMKVRKHKRNTNKSRPGPDRKWKGALRHTTTATETATESRTMKLMRKQHKHFPEGERYIMYAPHEGFSNQARQLKNALKMALLLNRTLVLPPVLEHFEVEQGTCLVPFRAQRELRKHAWAAIAGRLASPPSRLEISSNSGSIHEVDDDCRTTVWTNGEPLSEKLHLEQLLTEQLHNDSQLSSDTHSSSLDIKRKDVIETLGPSSPAGGSFLLSIGSTFSREYKGKALMVDIEAPPHDKRLGADFRAIEQQLFSASILDAGRHFVMDKIKEPFFCSHVRLEDGSFLSEQEQRVFLPLRRRLRQMASRNNQTNPGRMNIFLMTDLPPERWPGTYLHKLNMDPNYKIHTMFEEKDLFIKVSQNMDFHEHGLVTGFLPQLSKIGWSGSVEERIRRWETMKNDLSHNFPNSLPESDIRLFVEEVVCSCATLGFQGTSGSTISRNIMNMREFLPQSLLVMGESKYRKT